MLSITISVNLNELHIILHLVQINRIQSRSDVASVKMELTILVSVQSLQMRVHIGSNSFRSRVSLNNKVDLETSSRLIPRILIMNRRKIRNAQMQ